MSSAYTCITCHVAFAGGDIQRAHYKTDWHRYNLKRKVADLGPITAEDFQEKVAVIQKLDKTDQSTPERSSLLCTQCGKQFSSENGLLNHLKSRKHIEYAKHALENTEPFKPQQLKIVQEPVDTVEISENDEDWEDMDDGDNSVTDSIEKLGNALHVEECLFCSYQSSSLDENLIHMANEHTFFLPDVDYLKDVQSLIKHLDEKVGIYHVCLWCNKKQYRNLLAVQRHMMDKGHCKIRFDENPDDSFEYVDYYDYTYPDHDQHQDKVDEQDVDLNSIDTTGYELALPSGKKVGHRTLMRYYRQSFGTRNNEKSIDLMDRVKAKYRALGWHGHGTTGEVFQRKIRDLKYMQQWKSKHYMKLGVNNNMLQHHFREQVNF
ncbi:unnamed protein product [Didymodactylos carnosus]|uniref:C2H2-type domain-containing protein n=1 Tax=Didymodactylos carnosus TaxID=1234261 RepID=A0A815C1L5_9BILA|nr:unnamed protein product [Didymodactylos carnosus]CAF1277590.1 unnamed protein product [Didymodactylos carnosus]CAF3554927.1 unnamed protein product [Didymodactylos carnosus]CAF4070538.1 unnamed protein product [Didymodactylos carnosus]